LLVTVSIGVGFAITRTFGVAWSWIQFGEGNWAFDLDAFMKEMLPLVVIVPVMSLLSYFAITGAVRKYRAYLDSGLDYKNLVKSVRRIDDLQENRIKSLGDYPELRDSLLKLRERVAEREKALDEREAGLGATQEEVEAADAIKAEARVLTGAISDGSVDGFGEELALSVPEMKAIEQAIRKNLLVGSTPMTMNDLGEQMSHIRLEMTDSTTELNKMLGELSAEMVVSENGAREIELYLNQIKVIVSGEAGQANTGDTNQAMALVDRLDQTSAALSALGEETRSIAINTALHAGQGEGGLTELVKLADDVRDVAAKFNGISAQYLETGQQVRAAVQTVSGPGSDGQLAETMETMTDRVTYWAERAMVLGQKLNAFEHSFRDMTATFESKLGGGLPEETYQTVDDFSTGVEDESGSQQDQTSPAGDDGPEAILAATAAPIAGLEQNKNLFEEISGGSDDNLFADIPDQEAPESQLDATSHTGLTGVFERNEVHPPAAGNTGSPETSEETAAPAEPKTPAPQTEVPQTPAPQAQVPQAEVAQPDGTPQADQPSGTDPAEQASPAGSPPEMFEEMGTPPVEDHPLSPSPAQSRVEPGEFVQSQVDLSGKEKEIPPIPGFDDQPSPAADMTPEPGAQEHQTAPEESAGEQVYDLYELGAVDYEPTVHQSA
jgi:hypothetical protein